MTGQTKVILDEHIGERIDKVLSFYDESISRSTAQQLLKDGDALLNEQEVKPNYRCQRGDVLSWSIPSEPERTIEAEPIPLDIIYENDVLIVVNKKQGMVVHPTDNQLSGTLVNALLHHTPDLAQMDTERPGIVHRIDKDTSGLLVIAKTEYAFEQLSAAFKRRDVERTYEVLVHGEVEHTKGVIEAPIGRHPKKRLQMAVHSEGRYAKTTFTVLERTEGYTHLSCQLETGRTHQIRVHLEYIGHPIVNDPVYGPAVNQSKTGQMLFAKQISFEHPVTNERMEFSIDAPAHFAKERAALRFPQ